jgi:quercetin dioxygenase-like cupin family protein
MENSSKRFLDLLFEAWESENIPYLQQIVRSHQSCAHSTLHDNPDPAWNTKPISPPEFPWDIIHNTDSNEAMMFSQLQEMKQGLNWFQNTTPEWTSVNDGRSDESSVVVGNILGASIRSEALLLGFMFIRPGNIYPVHAHAAKEVYHILAGSCFLKKNDGAFKKKVTGDIVIHEPHEVHALETRGDSVLIIWANSGDIFGDYYFVPEKSIEISKQ